jgi:cation diffusion facilitator CzcD-associated flavoprotein CzcO
MASPTEPHGGTELDVLIIGAGFSGLGVAALLDRSGMRSFLILEAADDLGGTWRDNTYPGCACDIPSPLYSPSTRIPAGAGCSPVRGRSWTICAASPAAAV